MSVSLLQWQGQKGNSMAVANQRVEDVFPWEDTSEDSVFKYLTVILIIVFLVAAYFLKSAELPELKRQSLKDVSPRLAQLVIEKKKEIVKPKPIKKKVKPKKEKPKAKPKKKEKKKEPIKEKPKPAEKVQQPEPTAKEVAQSSGLLAFADELSDLRDDFDLAEFDEPIVNSNATKKAKVVQQDVLTAKATTGSTGIKASGRTQVSKKSLGQRKTAKVASTIKQTKLTKKDPIKPKLSQRSEEEIERVFQKNKGKIFTIYNRELRKDPSMKGKVVFALTIEPNGSVSKCIITSSEIDNKKLQKRLISKIKKFKFKSLKVPVITVNYPIDFLPS